MEHSSAGANIVASRALHTRPKEQPHTQRSSSDLHSLDGSTSTRLTIP